MWPLRFEHHCVGSGLNLFAEISESVSFIFLVDYDYKAIIFIFKQSIQMYYLVYWTSGQSTNILCRLNLNGLYLKKMLERTKIFKIKLRFRTPGLNRKIQI